MVARHLLYVGPHSYLEPARMRTMDRVSRAGQTNEHGKAVWG